LVITCSHVSPSSKTNNAPSTAQQCQTAATTNQPSPRTNHHSLLISLADKELRMNLELSKMIWCRKKNDRLHEIIVNFGTSDFNPHFMWIRIPFHHFLFLTTTIFEKIKRSKSPFVMKFFNSKN